MPSSVLIVGAGRMGAAHARAVRCEGDSVAAVVDPDRSRSTDLGARHGAPAYTTIAAALESSRPDLAVIASPTPDHRRQIDELCAAGLRVLVEKPHRCALEARPSVETSADARCWVGVTTRHWPGVEAAVRAVRSGNLGVVLSYRDRISYQLTPQTLPAWYRRPATDGGGVLLTNGVHALDRARAILGEELVLRTAVLRVSGPAAPGDDFCHIDATTNSGAAVTIELGWTDYVPPSGSITVIGTHGWARIATDGAWTLHDAAGTQGGQAHQDEIDPLRRQWRAFREHRDGFDITTLEFTMRHIDAIVAGHHG